MTTIAAYGTNGDPITYEEAAEFTRDMLDELLPTFVVGEMTYGAGRALEAVDPIAFRMAVAEEIDHRIAQGDWLEDAPAAGNDHNG